VAKNIWRKNEQNQAKRGALAEKMSAEKLPF
jgi:hypothetical protein